MWQISSLIIITAMVTKLQYKITNNNCRMHIKCKQIDVRAKTALHVWATMHWQCNIMLLTFRKWCHLEQRENTNKSSALSHIGDSTRRERKHYCGRMWTYAPKHDQFVKSRSSWRRVSRIDASALSYSYLYWRNAHWIYTSGCWNIVQVNGWMIASYCCWAGCSDVGHVPVHLWR